MGINNNSNYITGYGAPAKTVVDTNNGAYNTVLGKDASTTGTIYGVYDMAGGSEEYVMQAVMEGKPPTIKLDDTGFEVLPNEYYNFFRFRLKTIRRCRKNCMVVCREKGWWLLFFKSWLVLS